MHPSNVERQNIMYVLQVFNCYVAKVKMLLLGKKCEITHYAETSVFISIISTWWSIVIVKTPLKGKRLVNVFEELSVLKLKLNNQQFTLKQFQDNL